MTTRHSPLSAIRKQANHIAKTLKAAERGEKIDVKFASKIAKAREKECFSCGVVMDDKIITIEMAWKTIRESSEAGLSEYIIRLMRETRESIQ